MVGAGKQGDIKDVQGTYADGTLCVDAGGKHAGDFDQEGVSKPGGPLFGGADARQKGDTQEKEWVKGAIQSAAESEQNADSCEEGKAKAHVGRVVAIECMGSHPKVRNALVQLPRQPTKKHSHQRDDDFHGWMELVEQAGADHE